MNVKEGRVRSGYLPFRSQVLNQPRQNDRLRVMSGTSLYRYHTTTYPYTSDSANRRKHNTIFVLLLRWIDGDTTAAREWCGYFVRPGSPIKEGRFDLSTFRSERKYFIDHAEMIVIS
ncbi:uncharacterized protein TNCV_1708171 [Trichonephila clavipes]|nr:uncharacterized protein TNCV_1708171 [Trichonephila clavipes]